jgi:hypothetical protein
MKAKHKSARTTKGWRKLAPKTPHERRALLARCGAKAFLDPKNLKFPVMAKTGPCVVDCEGLRAAKSRAAQYKHRKVGAKAKRLGKRAACHWAV